MTRQFNGPYDLNLLNPELPSRVQEQEMNQSGWSMQRFIKKTMYIHKFTQLVDVLLRYHPHLDIYLI